MKQINYIVETDTETLTFPVNHEGLETAITVAKENRTNVDVQQELDNGTIQHEEVWNFTETMRWALA